MLTLWGRTSSSNVKKVMWVLAELGLDYKRIDAGRQFGVVDTDAFRAMNPNSLVPVLDDNGFILWESNAIARYLCAQYGKNAPPGFWPENLQTRARADRWMDWNSTTLGPAQSPVFITLIRKPKTEWDIKVIEPSVKQAAKAWAIVDQHLAKNTWLAGEHFSIGDVPLGILAYSWMNLPLAEVGLEPLRVHLPHFARWYAQLYALPNFKKTVDIGLT